VVTKLDRVQEFLLLYGKGFREQGGQK